MEMEMDRVHNKPQHTGCSELHASHQSCIMQKPFRHPVSVQELKCIYWNSIIRAFYSTRTSFDGENSIILCAQ